MATAGFYGEGGVLMSEVPLHGKNKIVNARFWPWKTDRGVDGEGGARVKVVLGVARRGVFPFPGSLTSIYDLW